MKGYEMPSMTVLAVEVEDVIRTSNNYQIPPETGLD